MQEEQETNYRQDKFLCYAWRIINGEGGGEYFYSLQEGYIYSYEQGYWKQLFDIEFLDRVDKAIPEVTKFSLAQRKQIMDNFKGKKYLRIDELNNWPLINFENCMFDPHGMNAIAHDKKYYSTIRIPYKYDQRATCPLWLKTLGEILEDNQEKINLLQEFFGYCLMPQIDQKKALLLLGETDTGKSTIILILKDLVGAMNCSNVPLQYLPNPQYTPLLINKMVNIDADVNKNAGDYEREFKIITSGETVSCNQKHVPTFEFLPKCKIVLAANIFPKITDHSSAFYQRLILIPCDRRFSEEEKNRNLHNQLREELPGIFNWMMEGFIRLKKRGRFEEHRFMREAVEELEDENNPVNVFFKDFIATDVSSESYIEKGDLYAKYSKWCVETNNYRLSLAKFSNCVYKKYSKFTPKTCRLPSSGKRIWRNLKYIDFKPIEHENKGWNE